MKNTQDCTEMCGSHDIILTCQSLQLIFPFQLNCYIGHLKCMNSVHKIYFKRVNSFPYTFQSLSFKKLLHCLTNFAFLVELSGEYGYFESKFAKWTNESFVHSSTFELLNRLGQPSLTQSMFVSS